MMELELINFEQQLPQKKSLQGKKMEDFGSNCVNLNYPELLALRLALLLGRG